MFFLKKLKFCDGLEKHYPLGSGKKLLSSYLRLTSRNISLSVRVDCSYLRTVITV